MVEAMPNLIDLPVQALAKVQQYRRNRGGSAELHYARKMFEAGAFRLEPPQNIAAMVADIRRWGEFGMIPALNARRTPNRVGDHRRRRRDDLQGTRRRGQRGRQRPARQGRQGRRRGRDPGPQPPLVPRSRCTAPRGSAPASSCSTASSPARRSRRSSEREGAKLIIYDDEYTAAVAQAEPRTGQAAGARHQPGQGGALGQHRRDAGRADRPHQHDARRPRPPSTRRSSS